MCFVKRWLVREDGEVADWGALPELRDIDAPCDGGVEGVFAVLVDVDVLEIWHIEEHAGETWVARGVAGFVIDARAGTFPRVVCKLAEIPTSDVDCGEGCLAEHLAGRQEVAGAPAGEVKGAVVSDEGCGAIEEAARVNQIGGVPVRDIANSCEGSCIVEHVVYGFDTRHIPAGEVERFEAEVVAEHMLHTLDF